MGLFVRAFIQGGFSAPRGGVTGESRCGRIIETSSSPWQTGHCTEAWAAGTELARAVSTLGLPLSSGSSTIVTKQALSSRRDGEPLPANGQRNASCLHSDGPVPTRQPGEVLPGPRGEGGRGTPRGCGGRLAATVQEGVRRRCPRHQERSSSGRARVRPEIRRRGGRWDPAIRSRWEEQGQALSCRPGRGARDVGPGGDRAPF